MGIENLNPTQVSGTKGTSVASTDPAGCSGNSGEGPAPEHSSPTAAADWLTWAVALCDPGFFIYRSNLTGSLAWYYAVAMGWTWRQQQEAASEAAEEAKRLKAAYHAEKRKRDIGRQRRPRSSPHGYDR